jgi:hypothetical protein
VKPHIKEQISSTIKKLLLTYTVFMHPLLLQLSKLQALRHLCAAKGQHVVHCLQHESLFCCALVSAAVIQLLQSQDWYTGIHAAKLAKCAFHNTSCGACSGTCKLEVHIGNTKHSISTVRTMRLL